MFNRLTVEPMKNEHARDAFGLWQKQFSAYCSNSNMFASWVNNTAGIERFITTHGQRGDGFVAVLDNQVVGYMAYDTFNFHGADSAFVPFVGNAATLENRNYIYLALYTALSKKWVGSGIRTHYFTISAQDELVKNSLFDLGFGSYVVDAFARLKPQPTGFDNGITVEEAVPADAGALYELVKETGNYYAQPPIFLKRDDYSFDELVRLIESSHIFLARYEGQIAGFLNLTIADEDDIFRMCAKGFGMVDEIGAYIKEEYRNRNIGNQLIQAAAIYCQQNRVPCVHVDFETANLYANKFWKKHFTPVKLSLKRTVHPDI